jgi:hypothetical protein
MGKMIAEQPVLITVMLALLAIAFLYAWTREGRKWLAFIALGLLALIPLAWLGASMIETDDERIRAMIYDFAAAVEANDHETVYAAVHPDRPDILARVESELPRYEFTRARVGGFDKIKVLPNTDPTEAVVELMASVTVSSNNGAFQGQKVARKLLLYLRETESGWKVLDYSHRPPIGGLDPYSSGGGGSWENFLHP